MNNTQAIDILYEEYTKERLRTLPDSMDYTWAHQGRLEAYLRALASLALVDDKLVDIGVKLLNVEEGKTDVDTSLSDMQTENNSVVPVKMKVKKVNKIFNEFPCPACGKYFCSGDYDVNTLRFCPWCGQELDWSEAEEWI